MLNIKKMLRKIARCCYTTGVDGVWSWKKYADGTFEAWRVSDTSSTGSMTQLGSTGIYYSTVSKVDFPAIGITSIKSCEWTIAPQDNFIMSCFINRLTASSVYMGYLRFGSGVAASNMNTRCHITGTWE